MEMVLDMGRHAAYVWPAYGAFAAIFAGLIWWVVAANARARKALEEAEQDR